MTVRGARAQKSIDNRVARTVNLIFYREPVCTESLDAIQNFGGSLVKATKSSADYDCSANSTIDLKAVANLSLLNSPKWQMQYQWRPQRSGYLLRMQQTKHEFGRSDEKQRFALVDLQD